MQPEELKQAIQKIKMWQRSGERAPHKPLLLLYALGRLARGEPRQMNYKEVKDDLKSLLEEFGPPRANHSPSYSHICPNSNRLPQPEIRESILVYINLPYELVYFKLDFVFQ